MIRDALLIFAKVPAPGDVKTRLVPPLTEAGAARLYEAFLRDALRQYRALDADLRLYLSPPADRLPPALVPEGVGVHLQRGEGLGPRMAHAFVETFAAGYERVVVIGTDHPTLPTPFIEMAFDALAEPLSVSIGPSEDGGYYLLGMNDFFPQLFHQMRYSHADVFAETLDRVAATRAGLTILPTWYDVDTAEALERLRADLQDPAVTAPHTRAALAALGEA